MNLYSLVFGENPDAASLLVTLGLKREDFGEYLDCWVSDGRIGVFSKDGGDLRAVRKSVFALMRQHPNYLEDRDEIPGTNYCTCYFRVPQTHRLWLDTLNQGERGCALLMPLLTRVHLEVNPCLT